MIGNNDGKCPPNCPLCMRDEGINDGNIDATYPEDIVDDECEECEEEEFEEALEGTILESE